MLKKSVLKKLKSILGAKNLLTDEADLLCYSYDASTISVVPDAVALPTDKKQISEILLIAQQEHIPIVARGAGTATTGSAVPVKGGLVICVSKMNQIKKISSTNLLAEVEPGVITKDIQTEVEKYGLFYPPDPASLKFCTIGGNVSTCAGGPSGVKYGVTKDYVLGLEVVLPNSKIINLGVKTAKGVVGYDLTKLFVGSEGTLGIITSIYLKLIPKPSYIKTIVSVFSNINLACDAITCILTSGIRPKCAELIDHLSLCCIKEQLPFSVPSEARALILIEVDGSDPQGTEFEAQLIKSCCKSNRALLSYIAQNKTETQKLWQARRGLSPALKRFGFPHKISEDICVPRSNISDMVTIVHSLAKKYNILSLVFGHAGDGNLHVNLLLNKHDKTQFKNAKKFIYELMETTLSLEGTISGEHGVGLTKKSFIKKELGDDIIKLMYKIKKEVDPNNIMNPGKLFPGEFTV